MHRSAVQASQLQPALPLSHHLVHSTTTQAVRPTSSTASHNRRIQASCLHTTATTSWADQPHSHHISLHQAAARVASCQHSSSTCQRSVRVRTRVFDNIKNLFAGASSGWAGQPEGQPTAAGEDDAGSDLVRIDGDSTGGLGGTTEDVYGPLAVLLVGFLQPELDAFRAIMNDMDADIVKLIPCTKVMLGNSLMAAMETEFPQYEQPPLGQRRAMFFSGMYGSEVTEVISAYRDAGLPPCVFAGLVPNNSQRTVGELLDAVWRDHAAMMAKLQQEQHQNAADSY